MKYFNNNNKWNFSCQFSPLPSEMSSDVVKPLSPLDWKPTEKLLFVSPDTRFGNKELNYIYLDARNYLAVTYPPMAAEKLDKLYRENYSKSPTEIVPPKAEEHSAYRHYFGGKCWEKVISYLPLDMIGRILRLTRRTTHDEIKQMLAASGVDTNKALKFFDVGCFEGALLDQLAEKTTWRLFGLEPNDHAVAIAQGKGYQVWQGHAENVMGKVGPALQFDVIHMGQSIEHLDDPVRVLSHLRLMLAPGGVLILSTPNLFSKQITWYGPTWSHWCPPYHRYIFSKQSLAVLAQKVGLSVKKFRTYSHFYWTAMSMAQNSLGLSGSVSHNVSFNKKILRKALRIVTWAWLFWDWRGLGDYSYVVLQSGYYDVNAKSS